MLEDESVKEIWIKPTKSGKGFILEIRERYLISKEALKKLNAGQIKGVRATAIKREKQEKKDEKTMKSINEDFL